jgi:hypothetical protein
MSQTKAVGDRGRKRKQMMGAANMGTTHLRMARPICVLRFGAWKRVYAFVSTT